MRDSKGNVIDIEDQVKVLVDGFFFSVGAEGKVVAIDKLDGTINVAFDKGKYLQPGTWWAEVKDVVKKEQ